MSNEERKSLKSKGLALKITIPIVIAILVGGIYVLKNKDDIFNKTPNEVAIETKDQGSGEVDYSTEEFALDATEDFDLEKILSYGLPVVLDFGADSCVPCKEMAPVLKELNEELRGKAIVKFVDVWKNSDSANNVPIRVIPTQFFFDKNGKPYSPSNDSIGFIQYQSKDTDEIVFTAHEGGMTKEQILSVLKELGVE